MEAVAAEARRSPRRCIAEEFFMSAACCLLLLVCLGYDYCFSCDHVQHDVVFFQSTRRERTKGGWWVCLGRREFVRGEAEKGRGRASFSTSEGQIERREKLTLLLYSSIPDTHINSIP